MNFLCRVRLGTVTSVCLNVVPDALLKLSKDSGSVSNKQRLALHTSGKYVKIVLTFHLFKKELNVLIVGIHADLISLSLSLSLSLNTSSLRMKKQFC